MGVGGGPLGPRERQKLKAKGGEGEGICIRHQGSAPAKISIHQKGPIVRARIDCHETLPSAPHYKRDR